jgi:hypothetical protein
MGAAWRRVIRDPLHPWSVVFAMVTIALGSPLTIGDVVNTLAVSVVAALDTPHEQLKVFSVQLLCAVVRLFPNVGGAHTKVPLCLSGQHIKRRSHHAAHVFHLTFVQCVVCSVLRLFRCVVFRRRVHVDYICRRRAQRSKTRNTAKTLGYSVATLRKSGPACPVPLFTPNYYAELSRDIPVIWSRLFDTALENMQVSCPNLRVFVWARSLQRARGRAHI